ncbi:MAG: sigma-E processing peptidase SpoIIGA, partial [Oscillospiraceae bacterium]|nr:sigma-E processing peptidase SpoIIGA [Oscillospiraceae bacterium]
MVVYADQVFFVNTAVNWLLLATAVALTGAGTRPWRLGLGAALGGLYALGALLPGLCWLGRLPGAALAFLGLCLTAFGCRGRAWKSWLWFFGVCCGFAGLVMAAASLLGLPVLWGGGQVWYRVTGRLLLLLAGALWGGTRLLLDRFALHRGRELLRLELALGPRQLGCAALRDTGNTLRDPLTGAKVPVARWQLAARLLPELGLSRQQFQDPAALAQRLARERPELQLRLIPFRAVGVESGLLLALALDRVCVEGTPAPTRLVAFSPTEL